MTPAATANSIFVIQPYWYADTWVFDDPAVGLSKEPFVSGIPQMIDALLARSGMSVDGAAFGCSFRPHRVQDIRRSSGACAKSSPGRGIERMLRT